MRTGILLLISVVLGLLLMGCGGQEPVATPTPDQSTEPESTPTQVETPTPTPLYGSYDSPAPLNETIPLTVDDKEFNIIADAIRGTEVNNVVLEADRNNEPPSSGNEYMLAVVGFEYKSGGESIRVSQQDFKVYIDGSQVDSHAHQVLPESIQEFETGTITPDEYIIGGILYEVPQDKKVLIAYQPDTEPLCFIDVTKTEPEHQTPTPTPTPTETETPTPTPQPTPEPITLSGSGDTVTESFELSGGAVIFHITHDGSSNIIVTLKNANTGERAESLVNEIGSYDGSTFVGVTGSAMQPSAGEYLLDIQADGNWDATIEQPRPTSAPTLPQIFSGEEDTVTEPFKLDEGLAKFKMNHDGSSNFIVTLYDKEGERVDSLVNEIGSYQGSTSVSVTGQILEASPGIHYLEIQADGNWEIEATK